jgi:hypothetical protein
VEIGRTVTMVYWRKDEFEVERKGWKRREI